MRFVYLHQYFHHLQDVGSTRSYEFAVRFAQAGHDVHVVTTDPTTSGQKWVVEARDGFTVHRLGVPYENAMSNAQRIRSFLRFALSSTRKVVDLRPDVVYATSTPLTIAIPALLSRLRGKRYFFEVRDSWPSVPIAMGELNSPLAKWSARRLERAAYRYAEGVVALSPGMARDVQQSSTGPCVVIPNSSDPQRATNALREAAPPAVAELLDWVDGRQLIFYGGTFGRANGVAYLVDLAQAVRRHSTDVCFLGVGAGAEWDAVRTRAAQADPERSNLRIEPPVPKAAIWHLFARATVNASLFAPIAALEDNSANKLFDSFAVGRPVAINYGGWQADLLDKTGAGIIMPRDCVAAADSLLSFVSDAGRQRAAAKASAELGRTTFSRDLLFEQLAAFLRDPQCPMPAKRHALESSGV